MQSYLRIMYILGHTAAYVNQASLLNVNVYISLLYMEISYRGLFQGT